VQAAEPATPRSPPRPATPSTSTSAATPPATPAPTGKHLEPLLLLNLEHVADEVGDDKVALLQGRLAQALAAHKELQLVTTNDLRAIVDLQAEKASVGCDNASCLAEVAAALGARYVVFGRVGKLDDTLLLQVSLYDAGAAKAVGRAEVTAKSLLELADKTTGLVQRLLSGLTTSPGPPAEQALSPLLITGAVTGAVGLTAAIAGGIVANSFNATLDDTTSSATQKQDALTYGRVSLWTAAAGGVVVVGGVVMFLLGTLGEAP
jgi:hypothetical protein